jgi:hypothetical protein
LVDCLRIITELAHEDRVGEVGRALVVEAEETGSILVLGSLDVLLDDCGGREVLNELRSSIVDHRAAAVFATADASGLEGFCARIHV